RVHKIDSLINRTTDDLLKEGLVQAKQAIIRNCGEGCTNRYQESVPLKFAGWLITAFAISLGAPFWFDLLNKVTQLRGTGTRVPTGVAGNIEQDNSGDRGTISSGTKIRG